MSWLWWALGYVALAVVFVLVWSSLVGNAKAEYKRSIETEED
jgi:hypothetical protein